MAKKQKTMFKIIAVLALVGVALSVFSYMHKFGYASGEFCDVNDTFNCDVVNQGPYSDIFGVPVALLGIIGYGFMFVGALLKIRSPKDKALTQFLLLASGVGFVFALYLTGIEAFVLHTWCIICLSSQIVIAVILALTLTAFLKER